MKTAFQTPHVSTIKPGTPISFVYGPGELPDLEFCYNVGKAYGIKRCQFGDQLRVKMTDCSFKFVSSFSKIGIGAYCHIS
jgi:hypothetical protein